MAIEWHYLNDYLAIGVDWNYSAGDDSASVDIRVYRWDAYDTNNYGGSFGETLSPDPVGSGSWSGYSFGSGSGTRQIESFATRTYSRTHGAYNVSLTINWTSIGTAYGGSYHSLGSGSHTWTLTVPARPSYAVKFNANGGSGAPSSQTKWYGETLTLSSTVPTREGYTFQGWATSSTAASAAYGAGGSYTANSAATLYAVWKVVAPSAPTSCAVERISDSKNTVTWTPGSGSSITYEAVKVERRVDGGSWSQVASVSGSATSYADATTSADHSYAYRVRASNSTGDSSYATSDTVYNTPAAPTKVTAARLAETTVAIAVENAANTATALELQRSSDGESWATVATVSGSPATSATDEPGGGTFYYRARNTRGELASAWSASSDAVVTICAPAAPELRAPASGSVQLLSAEAISFEWAHSPIDGSAQTAAELAHSTDGGSTWTTLEVDGAAQSLAVANAFGLNSTVSWRVRTKGAHADFGPWSAVRQLYVRQEPSVAFAAPADGFVVENTPVEVELQYSDASGSLAAATLTVSDASGAAVYSRDMGAGTACSIPASEWLPDDGEGYVLAVAVRSTSSLTASATRDVAVSFALPKPAALVVEPDPDTGRVSLVVNIGDAEGLEEPVSASVWRVSGAGRVLLGEGLSAGAGIVDRHAPLNADYSYEAATFADSGAANRVSFPARVDTPWSFLYFGGDLARMKYNLALSPTLSPSVEYVHYAGDELPTAHMDDFAGEAYSMSAVLMGREEIAAFRRMMSAHEPVVAKAANGDVFWAVPKVSLSETTRRPAGWADVTVDLTRVEGDAL